MLLNPLNASSLFTIAITSRGEMTQFPTPCQLIHLNAGIVLQLNTQLSTREHLLSRRHPDKNDDNLSVENGDKQTNSHMASAALWTSNDDGRS